MKAESTEREESLRKLGLLNLGNVHWDLSTPALYEAAVRRYEAMISHLGPLVKHAGNTPDGRQRISSALVHFPCDFQAGKKVSFPQKKRMRVR